MTQGADRTRLRVASIGVIFMTLMGALVVRLWFLQVLSHADYASAAELNQIKVVPIAPTRGRILDRNGEVLIGNRYSLTVSVRRDEIKDKEGLIARLAPVLGLPQEVVKKRLEDPNVLPYGAVAVAEDVPEDVAVYLKEHQDQFPGVVTEERPVREYPKGTTAAHVLGYVGEINPEQLANPKYSGYKLGSIIGRSGIEAAYEKELHGKPGHKKLEVDSSGKVVHEFEITDQPQLGKDVVTSLDARIQAITEESLRLGIEKARTIYDKESAKHYLATAGGAVVMDPRNGEVIALASFPSYDPAAFVGGISKAEFDVLASDPSNPLINRVTQAAFPPGSTFKTVTTAAALQEGVASRNGRFACPASYRYRDRTFRNWKSTDSGMLSVPQALSDSCDTVFYPWAVEFYKKFQSKQGEKLQDYARQFGFGRPTGIEIGDKAGQVPDAEWLRSTHKKFPKLFPNSVWLPGYTINMSIGQGDVLATPLQVANSYAAIANGGTFYRPRVAISTREQSTGKVLGQVGPVLSGKLEVAPQNLDVIKRGLQDVVVSGTARGAFVGFPLNSIPVAAKTGTAELQTRPPKQPYAWFAAYAPANDPRYVVVVMIEEGGHGGETAAPIARRIIEGLFDLPLSNISPAARTD